MASRLGACAVALAVLLALQACMGYPGLNGPVTEKMLIAPPQATVDDVFACVERSANALHEKDRRWDPTVTKRDTTGGIFETGNFGDDNVVGFRLRASYSPASERLTLAVKGSGIYHVDLGAQEAADKLASLVKSCMSRTLDASH